jgi:hypothetical protein
LTQVADVPVLLGFMEHDGLLYSTRFLKDPAFGATFARNWRTCGPTTLLGVDAAGLTSEHQALADRLARDYGVLSADGTVVTNGTGMTDIMTDGVFGESTFRLSQQLFRLNRPVYR